MRKINFRAWDKINKKWIKDFAIYSDGSILIPGSNGWVGTEKDYNIVQYTGLKDKNGVEIYEGDIYKCYKCDPDGTLGTIEWLSDFHNGWNFITSEAEGMVIIGNIYENPELLAKRPKTKKGECKWKENI